jgi:hypothetical protein
MDTDQPTGFWRWIAIAASILLADSVPGISPFSLAEVPERI